MSIEPIKQKLNNPKDALYYQDMIYILKKRAKLELEINEETEQRIEARYAEIEEEVDFPGTGLQIGNDSIFQWEFFGISRAVLKSRDKYDNKLINLRDCPELVQEAIEELEIKIASLGQSTGQTKQLKRQKRLTWL